MNYIEYLLILVSTFIGRVSISVFSSLVGIPIAITSSAIGLKICTITAGTKEYKSIIKKKKKIYDKIVLLAKDKLISFITHDELVLVLKEYDDMKQETKNFKDFMRPLDLACVAKVFDHMWQFIKDFSLFIKQCYSVV